MRCTGLVVFFVAGLCGGSSPAQARSAGIEAGGCDACHRDGKVPTVTLMAEPPNPAVGQVITLTVGVSQTNGSTAGFYLTTAHEEPGTFQAFESGTVASTSGVIHSTPRAGSGGLTTFKARWTASQATGVTFAAYALSANGDKTNRGDGAGVAVVELLVGCTGNTYFIDQDGDGYGSADPVYAPRKDCAKPPGYAAMTGDCDDFHEEVHPGASELCDLKDNDCDGMVDENVVAQAFCEDKDADGHGALGGASKMDCKPSPGFAVCDNDCDDATKTTYPGAVEICDGIDNNCDGRVDEGVRLICGVGLCRRYASGCSSSCTPGEPFAETCNGGDDDCDDVVDNGTNESLCGDATLSCVGGRCVGSGSGSGSGGGGGAGAGAGAAVGVGGNDGTSGSGLGPSSSGGGSTSSSESSGCSLGARDSRTGTGTGSIACALLLAGWLAARVHAGNAKRRPQ